MTELPAEKDHLISFLQANLKVPVTAVGNKLAVESEKMPPQELQRIVTKFIYKRNLNNNYYVSLDGGTVKISAFEGAKASKKQEKTKKPSLHQTAAQSWGL